MTEVYVKKEIMPLLLKAKCPLEKVIKQDFRPVYYTKDYDDPTWQDCDAYYVPTQSQVMKWLRKKGLHLNAMPSYDTSTDADGNEVDRRFFWFFGIYSSFGGDLIYMEENDEYDSYEEAIEAALKYYLNNLVE